MSFSGWLNSVYPDQLLHCFLSCVRSPSFPGETAHFFPCGFYPFYPQGFFTEERPSEKRRAVFLV